MLLTTFGNTLAASLADPALSEHNTPAYIGLGTSDAPVTLDDTTLSAGYIGSAGFIGVEIDSISVSGSKVTLLWKLPYDMGNDLLSSIREIGVFTKNGKMLIRREFPRTEKMDRTRIFGKITVNMPIL